MAATDDEASSKETDPRAYELASSFKNICNVKMPEVSLAPKTLISSQNLDLYLRVMLVTRILTHTF